MKKGQQLPLAVLKLQREESIVVTSIGASGREAEY